MSGYSLPADEDGLVVNFGVSPNDLLGFGSASSCLSDLGFLYNLDVGSRKYLDVDIEIVTRFLHFILLWGNSNKIINSRCNRLTSQALLTMAIIFMQKHMGFRSLL